MQETSRMQRIFEDRLEADEETKAFPNRTVAENRGHTGVRDLSRITWHQFKPYEMIKTVADFSTAPCGVDFTYTEMPKRLPVKGNPLYCETCERTGALSKEDFHTEVERLIKVMKGIV